MGSNTIGAIGVTLPPPQTLYPPGLLQNIVTGTAGDNTVGLPPGGDFLLPSGTFLVSPGQYSQIQIMDPVTTTWRPYSTQTINEPITISSDGVNWRLMNPTGFPIGAQVTNGGTGYTAAPIISSTAATSGNSSLWVGVVGGAISAINVVAGGSGANYSVPPIVHIAAPPAPGVQATAVALLSGGLVTGFTILDPGAGYASPPAVIIVPQSTDLNTFATSTVAITNARATAQLSYVGVVTAALMTNDGTQTSTGVTPLTLTPGVGGAGSGATLTAVMALTVTNITYTTPGSGYGAGPFGVFSFGGVITSAAAASNSNAVSTAMLIPRQMQAIASVSSGGISVAGQYAGQYLNGIIDGGLFQAPPTLYVVPGPLVSITSSAAVANAVLTPVMGGVNDRVFVQPV